MIDPISSFSVASVTRGSTIIDFQFIKPAVGKVGGYYLYISTDGITYSILDVKIDSSRHKELSLSTYDDDLGYTHFVETLSDSLYEGRELYFYIAAISTSREFSTSSGIVTVDTFPSEVTNLFAKYDSYEVALSWDVINTTTGMNTDFLNYEIYLSPLQEVSGTTLDTTNTSLLLNNNFTVGQIIYVRELFKRSQWFGTVITNGELDLTSLKLTNSSDVLDTINIDNIKIYIETSTGYLLGTTTGNAYIDTTFTKDITYIYKVRTITTAGRQSIFSSYPIYAVSVNYTAPYLRSPSNSITKYVESFTCNTSTGQTEVTLFITPTNYTSIYVSVNGVTLNITTDYTIVTNVVTLNSSLNLNDITIVTILTNLVSNEYWQNIKVTLIDKHYYATEIYSIPYSKTETFILKGYFGVSDCNLDIFINNSYGFTVVTDDYGQFEIDYKFPKGEITLVFQARDKTNIVFSPTSNAYNIKTLNLYTWYSILGSQYKQIIDELTLSIADISVANARYSSFTDRFQPLIELYKVGSEDDTKFRALAYDVFKMFEYVGYDEGLDIFLNAIETESLTDNWDHYEIYNNDSLFNSKRTGFSFVQKKTVISLTSTGLDRKKYTYGVTCLTSTGEETDAVFLTVDTRWWVPSALGINILEWTPVYQIPYYNIYRGTSTGAITYLTTITGNIFVDNNSIISSSGIISPIYNFTDYEPPVDAKIYRKTKVSNLTIFNRRPNWMEIAIYAVGSTDIPDYQLDRLIFFLEKLIPPEKKYLLLYCNNITVKANLFNLPPAYYRVGGSESTGLVLDVTTNTFASLPPEYAEYYQSYYDISHYVLTALYENTIKTILGVATFKWTAIGTPNIITFQYMSSANGLTWSTWSTAVDATDISFSTIGIQIYGAYVKYRFIWYSSTWLDADSITITSITY